MRGADNEPAPVDLTPLDPTADAVRWAAVVESTRLRVDAVLAVREHDPFAVVSGWARPILAAAAVALMVVGASLAARDGRPATAPHLTEAQRLAHLASSSLLHGHAPTAAELMGALRPSEGR